MSPVVELTRELVARTSITPDDAGCQRLICERLLPLGFRIVLCTRREETFETARAERLKVSGNPSQYDDLGIFIREQENIRRLAGESVLPVFEVDVSEEDIDRAADQVADWMEQTGGLYMAD